MTPGVSEYKLSDLLSSAGATIGIIIAGTIFLQFLSTKYTELIGQLRVIASEYRGKPDDQPRHGPLQGQIRLYRRRLVLLNWAATLGAVALLSLLAAVLAGACSMVYPSLRAIKTVGTVGLVVGLIIITAAVALELAETIMARKEIFEEIADLDDQARHSTWP